jgi:hypothetical protein
VLETYIKGYHTADLFQLRVDAAVFDICLRKHSRQLHRKMVSVTNAERCRAVDVHGAVVSDVVHYGVSVAHNAADLGYVPVGRAQGFVQGGAVYTVESQELLFAEVPE